jgi:hypothetical protein
MGKDWVQVKEVHLKGNRGTIQNRITKDWAQFKKKTSRRIEKIEHKSL